MAVRHFNLPDPGEALSRPRSSPGRSRSGMSSSHDVFVEIETAKSLVELPVPYAGTVTALLVSEGDTVQVGTPIISIDNGLDGDVAPVTSPSTMTAAEIADAVSATAKDDEIEVGNTGGAAAMSGLRTWSDTARE